jgi:hypothetical protein
MKFLKQSHLGIPALRNVQRDLQQITTEGLGFSSE